MSLINPLILYGIKSSSVKINEYINKAFSVLFSISMFINIVFPNVPKLLNLKASLFTILLIIVFVSIAASKKIYISRSLFLMHLGIIILIIPASFLGFLNNNIGASNQSQYYIMWPSIYFVFLHMLRKGSVKLIHNIIIFSTAFSVSYGIIFVLTQLKIIPANPIIEFVSSFSRIEENAAQHYGYVEIDFAPLSSAPFIFVYFIAFFIFNGYKKITNWFILIGVLILTLLSGRRALWLIIALLPLVIFMTSVFLRRIKNVFNRKILISTSVLLLSLAFLAQPVMNRFNIKPEKIVSQVQLSFQENDLNSAAGIRKNQITVLLDEWSERPIFGYGLGAVATIVRSESVPWSYEAFYHALLFQGGVYLVIVAMIFVIYILLQIRILSSRNKKLDTGIYYVAALVSYLIASSTNPYLMRIDGLWVFLFPLAFINAMMLDRRQTRIEDSV